MTPPNVVDADSLAAARLDPPASLAVFRALVGAAARPGQVTSIDLSALGDAPSRPAAVLLPALALLDLDHVVAVLEDEAPDGSSSPSTLLSAATGARPTDDLADADVVIAVRPPTADDVLAMRRGSAHEPELGARLVVSCRAITTDTEHHAETPGPSNRTEVGLRGPGVPDTGRVTTVDGVAGEVFDALATANRDFPAGIDSWFVADDGSVVAIPRSSSIEGRS